MEGDVEIIDFDYTFYTDTGEGEIETSEIELPSAATVLTAVHRKTGMVNNSVVVRKGIWPYAVALFGKFLTELKRFFRSSYEVTASQLCRVFSQPWLSECRMKASR